MAQVVSGNQIKLNDGKTINAQQGGWYDAQQFWGGTLSAPGVINSLSNQQGAGQAVSKETVQQTNPANWAYIQQQQATYQPSTTSQALPSTPSGQSGQSGAGVGFDAPTDNFDPVNFYETAYANSGVRDIEAQSVAQQNIRNEQVAKIKDNPYLSEATMTGRISKLNEKFAADQQVIQSQIATKKADVETQLNLQLKKLDINSQAATQALNKFNTLLSSGALSGASGQDIANITRSTGISSSMIQAAINASAQKNLKTSTISFDDGTNQGFAIINEQTGEIIKKQNIASSKPAAATKATAADELVQTKANFIADVKGGATPRQLVPHYGSSGGLSIDEIYRTYNTLSPWGRAQETLKQFTEGKFVS